MIDPQTQHEEDSTSPSTGSRVVAFSAVAIGGVLLFGFLAVVLANLIGPNDGWDVEPGIPVEVAIEAGASARSIYGALQDAGVARASDLEEAARSLGVEERLRAGTYTFETDSDPDDVVRQLVDGPAFTSENSFTVIEGWTVDRIVEELAASTNFSQAEFQLALRSGAITSPYLPDTGASIDAVSRWEGLLYPAKYPIHSDTTPVAILGAMADEMTRRLDAANWSRIDALGVSRYEALVIASLIEREAGTDEERPLIASVIYNRLAEPMRLQIDATVIYALGFNPGRVLAEHLEVDSPYNTYRIDGLPPTPIGTASTASIEAALDPEDSEFLFYVLGGEDGSHLFASTYEGHQANIARAREAGVLP